MPDTVGGLPLHPLVVHAVVVLLPLAVLGTVLLALRPAWRHRYGGLNALVAVVATALCPVAASSGEVLEGFVGDPGRHADLGGALVFWALPLAVLAVLLWLTSRRERRPDARPGAFTQVVAGLAVVAALATAFQVYRVGESGASAVWGDRVAAQTSSAG